MTVTNGALRRTRLWALFDRLALALLCGAITNLLIMCPPQVGKSRYWSQFFPAWWIGRNPDHRFILGSYGAQYAASWGRRARDVIARVGQSHFGISLRPGVKASNEWGLEGYDGGMITAGIESKIAGRSAEVAVADDIIADVREAQSALMKQTAWAWFEEEFCTRLQHGGRRVVMMTRRATDDPPGRILKLIEDGKEQWTVICLPAIAEKDEDWPRWKWSRKTGEALVPELHDAAEYAAIQTSKGPHLWAGQYQQRPYPRGGGDLKSEWFRIVDADPTADLKVRAWDLAWSESPNAKRTAGILMTRRSEKSVRKYHITDIAFGRWGSGRRNEKIVQQAKIDGKDVPIIFEQEGGSGGPAQIDELVRMLDGYTVIRAKATGSKELRADAMAAQAGVNNVTIRKAPWNSDFCAECDSFPGGPTIDMVDAAAHAYNWLADQPDEIEIPANIPLNLPGSMFPAPGNLFPGAQLGRAF